MALSKFRQKLAPNGSERLTVNAPRPWPVDPELSRRVIETRRGVERTRRLLALHVLPARERKPA